MKLTATTFQELRTETPRSSSGSREIEIGITRLELKRSSLAARKLIWYLRSAHEPRGEFWMCPALHHHHHAVATENQMLVLAAKMRRSQVHKSSKLHRQIHIRSHNTRWSILIRQDKNAVDSNIAQQLGLRFEKTWALMFKTSFSSVNWKH